MHPDDDGTRMGGGPPKPPRPSPGPAAPQLPATPEPGDTRLGGEPPKRPVAPSAAVPAAPVPMAAPDDGGETMFVAERPQQAAHSLQRVQPPGRTEVIYLDRPGYRLGRAEGSDIALYSTTASRQHALLLRDDDGWVLEAVPGKTILADGELVQARVRLRHQMRLRLGGDELVFHDENITLPPNEPDVAAAVARAQAAPRRRWWWLALALVVLVGLGLAALWWWHQPAPPAERSAAARAATGWA